MRRSKSYEVRDTMNIWNKYDFAMSGLGKKRSKEETENHRDKRNQTFAKH